MADVDLSFLSNMYYDEKVKKNAEVSSRGRYQSEVYLRC